MPDALTVLAPQNEPAQATEASAPASARPGASPDSPQLYLQFGAFSVQQTARNLASRLNGQIQQVEHRSAQVYPLDNLYKVQVGPYASRTEAVNAALRIQQETGQHASMALR